MTTTTIRDFEYYIDMMMSDDPLQREIGFQRLRPLTQIYIRQIAEYFQDTSNPIIRDYLFILLLESDLPQAQPVLQDVIKGSDRRLLKLYATLTRQHIHFDEETNQTSIAPPEDYPTFNWRRKIGTVADFPLYWHYSLFIWVPFVVFKLTPLSLVIIIFVSILVHELAHAVTCRFLGFGSGSITLWFYGGFFIPIDLNKLPSQMQMPERLKYALMIVAGPVSNLLLSLFAYSVLVLYPNDFTKTIAVINLSLAIFNLLPIPPLDGEKIVVALGLSYFSQQRIYGGLSIVLLVIGIGGLYIALALDAPSVVANWSPYALIGAGNAFRLSRKSNADIAKMEQEYEKALSKEKKFVQQ